MSIDATNPVTKIGSSLRRDFASSQNTKQQSVNSSKDSSPSANVTLSEKATRMITSCDQDINTEKVKKLKQEIREGKLVIDTRKIAESIIKEALRHVKRSPSWR